MDRRELLRQGGATLAVLTTTGLAGCSSDDDSGDSTDGGGGSGDGGGSDDGDTGSDDESTSDSDTEDETTDDDQPTQIDNCPREGVDSAEITGEFDGSVVSNAIEGIEVQSIDAAVKDDEQAGEIFELAITVTNTGDQTTHARDYSYDLTVYDDSCTVLEIPGVTQYGVSQDMEPGDTGRLLITPTRSEFSLDNIAAFEVSVNCSGPFADGVYCPEDS